MRRMNRTRTKSEAVCPRVLGLRWAVFLLAASLAAGARAEEKRVDWAPLPDAASLQKYMGYRSESGLLVLGRRCQLTLNTVTGVTREETLRFLVLNETGVRGASIPVNDRENATVETVDARTVLPDGRILPADPEKDVHRIEVTTFKKKEPLASLARVDFPAPVPGAVLDLHFTTKIEGVTFFYVDPVPVGQSTSLSTDYIIRVENDVPATQWSVTLLGGRPGTDRVTPKGLQDLEAHFGVVTPGREEPSSGPFYHREASLLAFLQWEDQTRETTAATSESISLDARGRLKGFQWSRSPTQTWWTNQMKELDEAADRFLSKPGRARDIDVASLAPASLPLERRLEALYRAAQQNVGYDPNATRQYYLTDVMRGGQDSSWQGTLLFAYLLERAGIPHKYCLVADRWGIRFSSIMSSSHLFGFGNAVRVEVPEKGAQYFMPGCLAVPFGTLPYEHQDSLAIWREEKKRMESGFTPEGPRELDRAEYRVEGAVAADGSFAGTVDLLGRGAAAAEFREWYRLEEYRRAHPRQEDKKKRLTAEGQKALLEKEILDEIALGGTAADLSGFAVADAPVASDSPLHLTCSIRVPALAQPSQGEEWSVHLLPLLLGFRSPFSDPRREMPIWFERSGKTVVDGTLRLPAGAKVLDLPETGEFRGPQETLLSFRASQEERDGMPVLLVHLEFERPLAVGTDEYQAWRAYESQLAARADSRCLVAWPAGRVLE